MMPPTVTTMSPAPSGCSSFTSCGTRVLCPPDCVDTPLTCTSFSIAWRATSSGVFKCVPTSTWNPRSADAVAITLAAFRGGGQRAQRHFDLLRIAGLTDLLQARDLCLAHGAVVDLAGVDLGLFVEAELVDADDDVLAAIDPRLAPRGGLLDP